MAGKTFTNASTVGATGTMKNNGAVTGTITTSGGSYTIPAGYHNGSGKVTGPTLANLIGNNATLSNAANLLTGNTAYGKNGTKYTGGMPNKGAVTGSITTSGGSYTIPAGYHNGSGKVTGPTLAALVGTNVTLTSNANLLTGNTAYGKNGVKYTGSMANKGAWTNTPTTKGKVTIPAGYHNGSGYVDTTSVYNKGMTDADAKSGLDIKGYRVFFSHSSSNSTGSYQTYMFTSAVDVPLFILVTDSDVSLASSNGELFYEVWHSGNGSARLYALIGAKDGTTIYHNSTGGSWPAYTIFQPTY